MIRQLKNHYIDSKDREINKNEEIMKCFMKHIIPDSVPHKDECSLPLLDSSNLVMP